VKHILGITLVLLLIGVSVGLLRAGDVKPKVLPPVDLPSVTFSPDQVVATINGEVITMGQLQKPLVGAYGLKILLYQVQLALAKQWAVQEKIVMTPADYDAELERTEKAGFQDADKKDYSALLEQLLEKKGTSRAEFDMVLQTNAILRKIAAPQLKDKISDDNVDEAFNVLYGETVTVKHIQCANLQEVGKAKSRLAQDEKFETVVRELSRNARTRELDGELPSFSRQTVDWGSGWGKVPQGFKDWAFNAKVGDISDPILTKDGYHILKLERRLAPKAVKLTPELRASLKAQLEERLMTQGINELRNKLAVMARTTMAINEPALRKQFELKTEEAKAQATEGARHDILSKIKPATLPSARSALDSTLKGNTNDSKDPSGTPAANSGASVSPTDASTGERPPATKSADRTPADKTGK
jgi:foldase protein PrsA